MPITAEVRIGGRANPHGPSPSGLTWQCSRPPAPGPNPADALRALLADRLPPEMSGMVDALAVLWTRHHRFDCADPRWPDRDRFVLSCNAGAMMLYALLHLTGHAGMGVEDLAEFAQLHSSTPGLAEFGAHPGIDATTGTPGEGLGMAVGMALAERMLAARFGRSLVDHRTWVIASDEDLAQGVGQEAAMLAGQLGLGKLTVLWHARADANGSADDLSRSMTANGWAVRRTDGTDEDAIRSALSWAVRSPRPTVIGFDDVGPLSMPSAKPSTGLADECDGVPPLWRIAGGRGAAARRAWLKRLARHPQRVEFDRVGAGRLPDAVREAATALRADFSELRPRAAAQAVSRTVMETLASITPEWASLATAAASAGDPSVVSRNGFAGRQIICGPRPHAMAAIMNGMALHGGLLPVGGTATVFADHMRPALRLAAIMGQRVIHILDEDGISAGEDGPSRQPVEHLAALRAMPNLHLFRPADPVETVECWELALRRTTGPSLLCLSRAERPTLRSDAAENRSSRGAYVLAEASGPRQATLVATGSEVAIAMAARELLAGERIAVAVVSMPCWALFAAADEAYRADTLGGAPRLGIEAACGFGWERWLGEDGLFIGVSGFGASAPVDALYRHFGITPEAVAAAVRKKIGASP